MHRKTNTPFELFAFSINGDDSLKLSMEVTSMVQIILYVVSIVMANVLTAKFAPIHLVIFLVPVGTWLIGFTFSLRDWVQYTVGRKWTYAVIGFALAASALSSHLLGDTLYIVGASALSFLISESTDTEIFTRYKASLMKRVLASGTAASILDSFIFAALGLIPAGFITWESVPSVVSGQILVKTLLQFIAVALLHGTMKVRKTFSISRKTIAQ